MATKITLWRSEGADLFGITRAEIDHEGEVELECQYSDSIINTDIETLRKIIKTYDENFGANQKVTGG